MSFNGGEVYAILGGRFSPKGFEAFNVAMNGSMRSATAFEARMARSMGNSSNAAARFGNVAAKAAQGGALVLAFGLAEAVKQAASFERSMRNVNSIAELTPRQFDKVRQSVLAMSRDTAQAPKVLADGLYQIYSSGIAGQGALKVLRASAVAASAGLTDTATSATAIVGSLNAYHLSASKAAEVSDVLFQTVNRGVITFPELAQTIGTVLPFANTLHVNLNQVGASISTLTKEGIPAAEATTYLKNSMVSFLKPSKDLTAAVKATGSASGEALIKSKGFQSALEAVIKTTDGSKAAIAKLFPDIRAQAAVFALTGSNAKTAAEDIKGFNAESVKGAAAKVFAEQAKSAAFQLQQLKANLSEVAIEVGTAVLPMLNEGAQALSAFLVAGQKSGSFAHIGQDVKKGVGEAVEVIGDIVHVGGQAIGTISQVAGALGHLAHIDLGDATQIEAILAAYLGFKSAQIVVPIILNLQHALQGLMIAARAGALTQVFGALATSAGPVGLAAVAVGGLAAALVLLGGHESSETRMANENAAAHKAQADAIKSVAQAERASADKGLAAKQSTLDLKDAQQQLGEVRDKFGKKSPEYARALINEQQAALNSASAHQQYTNTLDKQDVANKKRIKTAQDAIALAAKEVKITNQRTPTGVGKGGGGLVAQTSPDALRDQATAQNNLNARVKDYVQAVARSNVSDLSRQRLMSASTQITDKNAHGIATLAAAMKDLPSKKQAEILLKGDQNALGRVGDLIAKVKSVPERRQITAILAGDAPVKVKLRAITALIDGVPKSTVAKVLADTGDSASKLQALQNEINRVQGKQVTVAIRTVNTAINRIANFGNPGHASGRGHYGADETALVGEGAGPEWRVNARTGEAEKITAPRVMRLRPDDYVIPTEQRYRGRAMGLLASLARDMGIAGYKAGKKPGKAWTPHPVPAKYDPLRLPVNDIEKARSSALRNYDDAKQYAHDEPDKISALHKRELDTQGRAAKTATAKAKKARDLQAIKKDLAAARKKLSHTKAQLPALQSEYRKRDKQLKDAKAYQARIDKLVAKVNVDRDDMDLADKQHNQSGYDGAKKKRLQDLRDLQHLYVVAQSHVPKDSQYWLELQQSIGSTSNDLQDTLTGTLDESDTEASRFADTGFTDAETAREKALEKAVALAALTAGTDDDQAAQNALTAFLEGVLGADVGGRQVGGVSASDDAITTLAGLVKQARDNTASFLGGGSNDNQDLQAQLDQQRARADVAEANTRAAAVYAQAAFGAGDIGAGGYRSAISAAGQGPTVINNFNSLHPGDPQVHAALAETAVRGFGQQNPVRNSRTSLGMI